MNKKYDWKAAEEYFFSNLKPNGISLREISERHKIPYQTVRRYAAENEWHTKRYRAWVKLEHGVVFK